VCREGRHTIPKKTQGVLQLTPAQDKGKKIAAIAAKSQYLLFSLFFATKRNIVNQEKYEDSTEKS
jgi:hypothetical protein